jgi:hypothetical protein
VGVDVFFVLSGYLVTQLLLRDIATEGSIRFGRFYARRYRRLLPAAFVVLLVTATAIRTTLSWLPPVFGNSQAQMFMPTFEKIATKEHLTLSVLAVGGCPWQRHIYIGLGYDLCKRRKEDAYSRVIPALHPDAIVAVTFDTPSAKLPLFDEDHRAVVRDTPAFESLLADATIWSLKELRAHAGQVVLLDPCQPTRRCAGVA